MKRLLLVLVFWIGLLPTGLTAANHLPARAQAPERPIQTGEQARVEQAVLEALSSSQDHLLAEILFETRVEAISISTDQHWATSELVIHDLETGEVLPTEPGLAISEQSNGEWDAALPGDARWMERLQALPEEVMPAEARETWRLTAEAAQADQPLAPLRGYLLPWAAGKTVRVSQTVDHDRYTSNGTAHYSFDFYVPGAMFNIHASKSGRVKSFRDSCKNGDSKCSNWIVLEDTTTNPTTYQLYLHLAQFSIPTTLRTIGAPAVQGQFIGVADDTGNSTGHHLHYMVHTTSSYWWGQSVDITFDDVSINGGRPRVEWDLDNCRPSDVCVSFATSYVSGNVVRTGQVYGDILEPSTGDLVSASSIQLEGWHSASDTGVGSAQFLAKYSGEWHEVGDPFSAAYFELDWDLCADSVPDGPVTLALELNDQAGSALDGIFGLRHFIKNYACPAPPPACVPGSNQVALFADPDYQGECVVLGINSYNNPSVLGSLGGDNAASIRVGSQAQATLYMDEDKKGGYETFKADDSYLADNRVGANSVSSVLVQNRSTLSSEEPQAAQESLDSPGSAAVEQPEAIAAPFPFSETVESGTNGWVPSNTYWHTATDEHHNGSASWRYSTDSADYDNGAANDANLDSPAIPLPPDQEAYLRFWYWYDTEGSGPNWDQRWVQVSNDNGKTFTNIYQLYDDLPETWLRSPAISLSKYKGQSIKIRFRFDSVDAILNQHRGWYIDDITVSTDPPPACDNANEPNNLPGEATLIDLNSSRQGLICPEGDIDYYRFTGKAGDTIGAVVDALAVGSKLDPYLFLLDGDGKSVLAENDDQLLQVRGDSHLTYTLQRDGTYYLKVRAWDHPSAGSSEYPYTLRLYKETTDPSAAFAYPTSGSPLLEDTITLIVNASDPSSGISHVEFLWHSGDWLSSDWQELGKDWDGQDGWSYTLDTKNIAYQSGIAIYARVYDWSGNWIGTGAWNLTKATSVVYMPFMRR